MTVKPYTMLSYPRLSKLYELGRAVGHDGLQGGFVECGVWHGGSAGVLAGVASRATPPRPVWLFDSWEGLPEPQPVDVTYRGKQGRKGQDLGSEEKARGLLFRTLRLSPHTIHLVRGWFHDRIPPAKRDIGPIVLLHLDCDWYESVRFCLDELYDQVVEGGYVVIDDYGHWMGARKGVDEFLRMHQLPVDLAWTDDTGVYFKKPAASLGAAHHLKEFGESPDVALGRKD